MRLKVIASGEGCIFNQKLPEILCVYVRLITEDSLIENADGIMFAGILSEKFSVCNFA